MSVFTTATQLLQNNQNIMSTVHWLDSIFISVKLLISLFGTITILIGAVIAVYRYVLYRLAKSQKYTINGIRLDLAQTIILGLEFFVASDVIETTIAPDFFSLGILAVLVIIRTILNWSMEREINNLSARQLKDIEPRASASGSRDLK